MADWHNFYMLAGGTAGTLIGLIFIVITLGMEHSKAGRGPHASSPRS
jgi:hypothetical protein